MSKFKYNSVADYIKMSETEINKCVYLLAHMNHIEAQLDDKFLFDNEMMLQRRKLKDRLLEHQNYLGINVFELK